MIADYCHITSSFRQQTNTTSYFCFSTPDAPWFQNQTTTQWDCIVAYLTGSQTALANAVTDQTTVEQDCSFHCWVEFYDSTNLGVKRRTIVDYWMLCPSNARMCEGHFSADRFEQLSAGMVTKAISHVSMAFWPHGRPNPTFNDDGQLSILLHCLYRGYKNLDPSEWPQKAITASVLQKMCKPAGSAHIDRAMSQLEIITFFFAMHSCEYCKTQGTCRAKLLTLQNLHFFSGKRELSHYDPYLSLTNSVSIAFEYQKWDQQDDTITYLFPSSSMGHHQTTCLILFWNNIVFYHQHYYQ